MLVFDFAIIFGVAAITIILTSKFKLPSILGYLLAGVIVGPYVPIPLFADATKIEQISELGVILVMFSIGLEFRLKRFIQILPSSGLRGLIQISTLFVAGSFLGSFLGWSINQSFLLGTSLAISSTMIANNVLSNIKVPDNAREVVFGNLIVQDIFAIVIITITTSLSQGQTLHIKELGQIISKLAIFIAVASLVGRLIVPKFIHFSLSFKSPELTTVISCGLCFTFAVLTEHIGYSVALGAFVAGILVAESGRGKDIEHNISQLKSIFSAMFFISVGMTINPMMSFQNIELALIVSGIIISLQLVSNLFGGILSGYGIQTSLIAGMALGQIGEFSFIIASLGKKFGFVSEDFYSMIVTAAVITSITTPIILKNHSLVQRGFEKILPKRIQTLILIYLSWYNNEESKIQNIRIPLQKNIRHIGVTISLMIIVSTLMSLLSPFFIELISKFNFAENEAKEIYLGAELFIIIPFIIYAFFCAFKITHSISQDIWQIKKKQNYIYQLIIHGIRFSILFVACTIILLMALPFLPASKYAFIVLIISPLFTLPLLWRKTENLQGQMEEALNKFVQTFTPTENSKPLNIPRNVIPGLEDLTLVRIDSNAEVAGKTLSNLDLRVQTGATIFAIIRNQQSISLPGGTEILMPEDLIAIAGGDVSINDATDILTKQKKQ